MGKKGKKAKIVFVTTMHRYGDFGKHSYVIGVFSKKHKAQTIGAVEEAWRGGKYEHVVTEFEIDKEN